MPIPLDLHHQSRAPRGAFPSADQVLMAHRSRWLLAASLALSLICTSCGAVGSGSPPPVIASVTITVTASSQNTYQGQTDQFHATVENAASTAVTWQVNGMSAGNSTFGTIDSTGLYTAPAVVPGEPTITVTAVLQSDATKTGSSTVTILSFSAYTGPLVVSPALSSITTSQSLQFNILTPGFSSAWVTWSTNGGAITSGGQYTPPSTPGSYTVLASLPNTVGSATVEVTNFPGMLTWRNDNVRSGVNGQELALSPETVNSSTFGKLFSCQTDGYVYAQPLYVPNLAIPADGMRMHNVIFVATEMDSVYAFDADASPCQLLWKQSNLIPAGSSPIATPNVNITSTDIAPFVGITGTPVISLSASLLYVVVSIQTPASTLPQLIYALDLATGQPQMKTTGQPITTPSGQTKPFDPISQNQRPALLLDNGNLYVAFGSYGGDGEYHGWLFSYDSTSLAQTGVFDVTPNALQGGIWQSGGGPSADSNHNVFVVTGDGKFDASRSGVDYGDSFIRFGPAAGLSSVADYFTPCDEGTEQIVGSSAPVLLPDSAGSATQPHLLIGASKGVSSGGALYVVNRDSMGGFVGPCTAPALPAQMIPVGGGPILSTPLFWNGAVYVAPGNANLLSFPMSAGILASVPLASQSPEQLGPQGATPVLSWNGSSSGSSNAVLWLIDSSGAFAAPANSPAILRAYDPSHLSNELYNSTLATMSRDQAGLAVKFTVPTVANGKVYVGTQTELDVYGLLQ